MGELKFALKCLAVTALLIMLSQIQVGSNSIEEYSQNWLRTSKVAQFVQNAARGGARLIQDGIHMGSKMISKSETPSIDNQKASRFNFEIKRSVSAARPAGSERHLQRQNYRSNLDQQFENPEIREEENY